MLLICTIWGFNFVAAKVGVQGMPPLLFTGLRFLILLVVMLPFLKVAAGRMGLVVLVALFNGAIHFGLMFTGVALAPASVVAVVAQLHVPFATLLSVLLLGEVVRLRRWAGIALTFGGVTLVSFDPHVFEARAGVLFSAAAALSGAIAAICMRRLSGVGAFQLQAWTALITAPLLLGASLLLENGQVAIVRDADALTWGALLFTTIGASLIGHNAYYYLLQRYEVSVVTPLSLLSPLLGVVFGIALLGEPLSLRIGAGALVALLGVGVLAIPPRRPR